jgi:hypothetical protein
MGRGLRVFLEMHCTPEPDLVLGLPQTLALVNRELFGHDLQGRFSRW